MEFHELSKIKGIDGVKSFDEWHDYVKTAPVYKKLFIVFLTAFCIVILSNGYYPISPHPYDILFTLILFVGSVFGLVMSAFWIGHDIVDYCSRFRKAGIF